MLWELKRDANYEFLQLGGSSRVGEMILARERSGFAGEKVWDDIQVVPGTASPYEGLSLSDPINPEEDDSEIPPLEDIYQNSTDGIFTTSSFDDEGAVADFTNLETVVNEPRRRFQKHLNESWVDAMQEELLQFEIQKVWVLVDLPYGKKAIGTKWVYRNKKDERGVVVRNKARLVAQGHRQEEGIDYDEVLCGPQPPGFLDSKHPQKVYKVVKALYGLHQAPRACQDKYVAEILKKFDFANVKTASTPIETQKPLVKDEEANDVDVHLYRSLQILSHLNMIMLEQILTGNPQQEVVNFLAGDSFLGNARSRPLWLLLLQRHNMLLLQAAVGNTICIVKNPVYHSKTKHIAIRHHFIRDAYEKKLIQVLKIHTDDNVADLLTKAFDVSRDLKEVSTASANLVPLGKVCTAFRIALISLFTTFFLLSTMAVLDSCPKHNMIAYLEETEGNVEFHEIIDFLTRSSIHHALTVSPVVSTTFVEQFWTSAKSKTINNVRHITAKVAGKSVSISEVINKKSIFFYGKQLVDVSVPLDLFPVNTLTSKVFSFMVKKGKHFSGKVTPLFATMLVQPTQDRLLFRKEHLEALPLTPSPAPTSEVPYEPQTDSSPAHTSEVPIEHQPDPSPRPSPTTTIPDSIPESFGENLGGHSSSDKSLSGNEGDMTIQDVYDICLSLCQQVSDQAKEIQALKAQITKLKKQAKPVIKHHKAYMKSVSLKQRFPRKSFSKKHRVHKESVSKQGRKFVKGESSVQRDPLFDEVPEDTVDHIDTENAQSEGRTREIVDEDKEIDEVRLNSIDGSEVSTDRQIEGTYKQVKGTEEHNEGIEEIFEGTEEQREGTEEKVESTDEQIQGTEDQTKDEIKFKQLESDEELARKVQKEWEEEEERNRIAEENAANEDLIRDFDDIKARIEADRLLLLHLPFYHCHKQLSEMNSWKEKHMMALQSFSSLMAVVNFLAGDSFLGNAKSRPLWLLLLQKQNMLLLQAAVGRCLKSIQNTSEDDSEKENDELRLYLTIALDEEKEVDYEILDRKYPIKEWKTEEDLNAVYQLVMDIYQDEIPKGFDKVLWGDLMVMFNPDDEDEFWNSQQEWNI
ncbi:putative ribonuclease H-like domain-containing protein, partial [Tanacetum coccineum]